MSWKTIVIKEYTKLSLKFDQLCVTNKDKKKLLFSLEDINCIVLENNYTHITTQILSKLVKSNIFLIICDNKFDPCGIIVSLNQHFQPFEMIQKQIKLKRSLKIEVWNKLLQAKYYNCMIVLKRLNKDSKIIEIFQKFYNAINNRDYVNREGFAAKLFFETLYGRLFRRFSDDIINKYLNYGYKILLSCLSRTISKYGINNCIGIFHKGKTNQYNLAYDFIEPLRPFIDEWVNQNVELIPNDNEIVSYNHRLELINILNKIVEIDKYKTTISRSIDIMIKSFISVLKYEDQNKILVPKMLEDDEELKFFENENT